MTARPALVVLDGHTLNPGDLSWQPLEELADCTIYERTPRDQVVARAHDADLLFTNKVVLDAPTLAQLPKLRYIGVLATGYNVVDVAAAAVRGITVTNVPAYSTDSVAQRVFAHLLHLTNHVADHAATVRAGKWSQSPDFCYWDTPLVELAGLTIGIVGYGQIGAAVARIAHAFGMTVIATSRTPKQVDGVRFVSLDDLFREADVVTLHCPLTDDTKGLVNADRLAQMKPTAFLINTGRGPLIDESALAIALAEGRLAGAGLDVLSAEPPPANNPLLTAPKANITPHQAWATKAARQRLMTTATKNVKAYLAGKPQNVVS